MGQAVRRCAAVAMVAPLLIAACRGDRPQKGDEAAGAAITTRDPARVLGPGDIQITTDDGAIELALIGDSIVTGLGKRVLDEIRDKTDTNAVSGSGLGAGIEKMVKGAVAAGVGQQIQYPLVNVQDVRYEGGRLQFIWKDGTNMKIFEGSRTNGKPVSESFRPEDAQRFVDAVRARKASEAKH